jgi:hypothetical protein
MSVTTSPPPVVVKEKRGPGCLGCGCGILLIILLLAAVLVGAMLWEVKKTGAAVTSTTPGQVPTYDGGDAMFQEADQKFDDFTSALGNGQPASLVLNANEINTLLAHDPDIAEYGAHLFVALPDDNSIDLKAALSGSVVPFGLLKGRYSNLEVDFTPAFDPSTKSVVITLHQLKSDKETMPASDLTALQTELNTLLGIELEQSPGSKNFLDHAKSITVQNGQIDIETQ